MMSCKFIGVAAIITLTHVSAHAQKLFLFGGEDHDILLGCYNCAPDELASICNLSGNFGNPASEDSLFNPDSVFGDTLSPQSPWNPASPSKAVPAIIDQDGTFFGYFTINHARDDAFELSDVLNELYEEIEGDLGKIQSILCDSLEN